MEETMRYTKAMLIILILFGVMGHSQAAVLLDKVVTWSELYRSMEADASPQLKELKEEERLKIFKSNEAAYLETLINARLQVQEAKNMSMSVSDDEIKEAIESIKKKYSMSDEEFKASLKKEGFA